MRSALCCRIGLYKYHAPDLSHGSSLFGCLPITLGVACLSKQSFVYNLADGFLLLVQPAPVKIKRMGPVNQHLHGAQPQSPSPEPDAALVKRTRGKDKHPRGPRKKSKRTSKDTSQRREGVVSGSSSRSARARSTTAKRHARKPAQTEEDVPQVMKRPQRKRKAPVSADASPVAAVPTGTHAMSSRKRTRAPVAPAPTEVAAAAATAAAAKPKRSSRPAKKAVQAVPEHAVAQAVPGHISEQPSHSEQQVGSVPQQQANAVAVHPQLALAGNSVTAPVPSYLAEHSQPAASQAQVSTSGQAQSSHPSALLLLAQQQMQQRLSQAQPAGTQHQESSSWSQAPGADAGQDLRPLGNATAQQALLAQLISQQAAQGLSGYSLDGHLHPYFSQGLAGAFLRQAMPAQPVDGQQQAHALSQPLSPQQLQNTAAVSQQSGILQMPQAGMLYPGQIITAATILPSAYQSQAVVSEQALKLPGPQAQEAGDQAVAQQPETQALLDLQQPEALQELPDATAVCQDSQCLPADAPPEHTGAVAQAGTSAPVGGVEVDHPAAADVLCPYHTQRA